ncbi:MAG: hypothetical protein SNF33_06620 [Candidatus Algichlamydia australiensis]|nr:hypothetical protein [Chlamydiales bacterium]
MTKVSETAQKTTIAAQESKSISSLTKLVKSLLNKLSELFFSKKPVDLKEKEVVQIDPLTRKEGMEKFAKLVAAKPVSSSDAQKKIAASFRFMRRVDVEGV